jgi:hypothetical protein
MGAEALRVGGQEKAETAFPCWHKSSNGRGMAQRARDRDILFIHLKDVFLEACAVFEHDQGKPPSPNIEKLLACRIAQLAKEGERDTDCLRAAALEGLIDGAYSIDRPSPN